MVKKVGRFIYWTPRLLAIIFIAFLALMSLDVISPELSTGQIALGMLMHNIPTIIMLVILIISWKREIVGGIAFILAGGAYIVFTAQADLPWYIMLSWAGTIAAPAFLIGILFLVNWFKKKRI